MLELNVDKLQQYLLFSLRKKSE
ncbi:hypothetical protein CP8484711_0522, partial [Chlamydia psittaci 84-8471/1]